MSGECDKPNPWINFLYARHEVILSMSEDNGYNDKEIAEYLSLDEMQVYMIRTTINMPIPEGKKEYFRKEFTKVIDRWEQKLWYGIDNNDQKQLIDDLIDTM